MRRLINKPITRKPIDGSEITTEPGGDLRVVITLDPPSWDSDWTDYFNDGPIKSDFHRTTAPKFRVERGQVTFGATEANFEDRLKYLDACIEATNKWFFEQHLPEVERREKAAEAAKAATQSEEERIRAKFRGTSRSLLKVEVAVPLAPTKCRGAYPRETANEEACQEGRCA